MPAKRRGGELMLVLLVYVTGLIVVGCNRQFTKSNELRGSIVEVVKRLEKSKGIDTEAVGDSGVRTSSYKDFMKLSKNAKTRELLMLVNHDSVVVRGYSFWALAKRHYGNLEQVLLDHASDEASLYVLDGCLGMEMSVFDFMSLLVGPKMRMFDNNCKKLLEEDFINLKSYSDFVEIVNTSDETFSWSDDELIRGRRMVVDLVFDYDGPCSVRPCYAYQKNRITLDAVLSLVQRNPHAKIGLGVFMPDGGDFTYNKTLAKVKANGIQKELELLGVLQDQIITYGFGNKVTNPNYQPIDSKYKGSDWVEIAVLEI